MRLHFDSLKFKISVLGILILAAILTIYSSLLFLTFRFTLYQELDSALAAKAQKINNAITAYIDVLGYDRKSFEFSVNRVIAQTGEHPHKNKIERLEKFWLSQSDPLDYVEFLDSHGNVLAHSNNLHIAIPSVSLQNMQAALKGHPVFKDIILARQNVRWVIMPAIYEKIGKEQNYAILVATSRERVVRILKERLFVKSFSILVVLVIASFLSHYLAKRILRPIQKITETARNINYKDLSVRIKTDEVDEEMKDLVDSLNEMMSRLEKSFQYIAEFSSHVSHEIKTPLAIMRGESELALRLEHSTEEYREVIKGNLEEVARMSKIVEDLLLLTKLDYQPYVFTFEDFNLTEFFKEIGESIHLLADEKNISVEVSLPGEPILIRGDKVHLRRLFFNLINNSIKFTPSGGTILVRLRREGKAARITFTDNGAGIPEENLPKIFDKFFHFNATGHEVPPGNGLGLSIAQSIAKIHSGEISVKSRLGEGSTFTVWLPVRQN